MNEDRKKQIAAIRGNSEKKEKKPFYTRADGQPETKKEYQKRHFDDLAKYENN